MPELPEVETIARGLAAARGLTIHRVLAARSDYVRAARRGAEKRLVGRRIADVGRHGKRLTLRLSPEGALLVHLGMSGQVTLVASDAPLESHTHLRLDLGSHEFRLRDPRRFGGVWIQEHDDEPLAAARVTGPARHGGPRGGPHSGARNGARPGVLGPDAWQIPEATFVDLLSRPRQIKALLLDQGAIAGLGNIYCDEALWAARIHPLAIGAKLPRARRRELHEHLQRILGDAIRAGGSTLRDYRNSDGEEGEFQRSHRVYGREGEPCPRCDAPIRRRTIAGRSSHVCLRCQRPPRQRRPSG